MKFLNAETATHNVKLIDTLHALESLERRENKFFNALFKRKMKQIKNESPFKKFIFIHCDNLIKIKNVE